MYDPAIQSVVLYGGCVYNDTWLYHAGIWRNVTPAVSPPYWCGTSMTYDSLTQQVILFGGGTRANAQILNQTWAFNGTAWEQLHPSSAPSPRSYAMMTYDGADGWNVLVGGGDNETWIFGAGNVSFSVSPPASGSVLWGCPGCSPPPTAYPNGSTRLAGYGHYSIYGNPNPGYHLGHWNISGNLSYVPSSHQLTVFGNGTVSATFLAWPTVVLRSDAPACSISFNGTTYPSDSSAPFVPNRTFNLSAPSCSGLAFSHWNATRNATIVNAALPSTRVNLTGPAMITAHFLAAVSFTVSPAWAGTLRFNGILQSTGTSTQVSPGVYSFQVVTSPGAYLSSLATTPGLTLSVAAGSGTATVNVSGSISANFVAFPLLTFSVSPSTCGPIEFNGMAESNGTTRGFFVGTYSAGAPACPGYLFHRWVGSANVTVAGVSSSITTVRLVGNGSLRAVYLPSTSLTLGLSPPSGGVLTWNGTIVTANETFQVLPGNYSVNASPYSGWKFVGWNAQGNVKIQDGIATVSGSGNLTAEFSEQGNSTVFIPPSSEIPTWVWPVAAVAAAALAAGVFILVWRRRRGGTAPATVLNSASNVAEELLN
ncbi:MAG: hypothetical protein L3K14_00550 [Thermoplasmata archaeon]|nr:hypothetical protein [Thermoplasmata archaeon]